MSFGFDYEEMSENDLRAALPDANIEQQIEIWKRLASFEWERREYGNASAIYQTVYDLCISYSDPVNAQKAKYAQGGAFFNGGEFAEAKDAYLISADLSSQEGFQSNLAESLWAAADSALSLDDYDQALRLALEAERIADLEGENVIAGKSAFISMKALNITRREEESLVTRVRARDYYRNVGDIEQVSRIDDYAIGVLWDIDRYDEATEIARDVLLKWTTNGDTEWIAYSNYRLGKCLQREEKYEESNRYLETARVKYLEVQKVSRVADCEQEISRNLFDLDQHEESIQKNLSARSLWDGVGDDWQAIRCDALRAVSYHMLSRFHEALKLNNRIMGLLAGDADHRSMELEYLVRGRAADNALELEDYELVLRILKDGPELGEFVPPTNLLVWRITLQARALYELGREDEALVAANSAMDLTDEDLINWNTGFIYEIRSNVLLHKNRREGEKDLAHAIALHLANGYNERAIALSKYFIPKIESQPISSASEPASAENQYIPTLSGDRDATQSPSGDSGAIVGEEWHGEAYCVSCKDKRTIDGHIRESESGRRMAYGVCPVCGTKMNRILGKEL
jgi:hypothetical protein